MLFAMDLRFATVETISDLKSSFRGELPEQFEFN